MEAMRELAWRGSVIAFIMTLCFLFTLSFFCELNTFRHIFLISGVLAASVFFLIVLSSSQKIHVQDIVQRVFYRPVRPDHSAYLFSIVFMG